jgi:hypothetical protein
LVAAAIEIPIDRDGLEAEYVRAQQIQIDMLNVGMLELIEALPVAGRRSKVA